MSRPCVCGGSNENCRYCSGRGEIPDRLANALTAKGHRPESQKVHGGGTEGVAWGSTNPTLITPTFRKKMNRTLRRMFQRLSATAVPSAPPSPVPSRVDPPDHQWVLCPKGCGSHLRPDEVHRHLQQGHVQAGRQARLPGASGCGMDKHCERFAGIRVSRPLSGDGA